MKQFPYENRQVQIMKEIEIAEEKTIKMAYLTIKMA